MSQQETTQAWHKRVSGLLVLGAASLLAAYLVGSRAIFTGSLQQYVLTVVLLILAVNRIVSAIRRYKEQYRG